MKDSHFKIYFYLAMCNLWLVADYLDPSEIAKVLVLLWFTMIIFNLLAGEYL